VVELHKGQGGPWPPLGLQILHYMNSNIDTIYHCSIRVAPLILPISSIKLRQWVYLIQFRKIQRKPYALNSRNLGTICISFYFLFFKEQSASLAPVFLHHHHHNFQTFVTFIVRGGPPDARIRRACVPAMIERFRPTRRRLPPWSVPSVRLSYCTISSAVRRLVHAWAHVLRWRGGTCLHMPCPCA